MSARRQLRLDRAAASAVPAEPAVPRRWFRLRAAAGVAGPAAFTGAWIASSLRQAGYGFTEIQISGLAAPNARDPWMMITGFVVLGGCMIGFGSALHESLDGSGGPRRSGPARGNRRAGPAPRLIQAAGVLTIAAGLLRRDHMLLDGTAGESWHNHAHDVISALIYVILVAVPLLLAWRFRKDPGWSGLSWPLLVGGVATAVILIVFKAGGFRAWDGVLQRAGVSIPLLFVCALALRLIRASWAARSGPAARDQMPRGHG
jgi:Protein of unknown function (DUF998)